MGELPTTLSHRAQQVASMIRKGMTADDIRRVVDDKSAIEEVRSFFTQEHHNAARRVAVLRRMEDVAEDGIAWLKKDGFTLASSTACRAHRLRSAFDDGHVFELNSNMAVAAGSFDEANIFVITHDWAGALGDAVGTVSRDEITLPYPTCAFELFVNGRCVVLWAAQPEGQAVTICPFIESPRGWWTLEPGTAWGEPRVFTRLLQMVDAVCIALDADVATTDVIRAPGALNRKRAKKGKPALQDFRIVKLNQRRAAYTNMGGTHRSPRLHFRRGHWRHYSTHRSWVRWTLVGDPNLGFVDKMYRI